jgi:hypothetical protein
LSLMFNIDNQRSVKGPLKFKGYISNGKLDLRDKPFPPNANECFAHPCKTRTVANFDWTKGRVESMITMRKFFHTDTSWGRK